MNYAHLLPMFVMFILPTIVTVWRYVVARKEGQLPAYKSSALPTIVNSAVLYALAYNFIFFIQELFLVLGKNWLGLTALLYHNNHSWEGSHPKESLAQGSGAAAIFLFAILFYMIQRALNSRSWVRVLFIWLSFQGFMQSLPQFATAPFTPGTDTGQAFTYLQLGEAAAWVLTIGGFGAMVVLLAHFGRLFIRQAPAELSIRGSFRYLRWVVLFAALIGTVLILPFRIPPMERAMAAVFLLFVTLPSMMAFSWGRAQREVYGNEINKQVLIVPLVLLGVLLLVFQLYLRPGVVFHP
jgi:hypothetical protein